MSTNVYQYRSDWDNSYNIPVLATEVGLRAPRSLTIDLTQSQATKFGAHILRPGHLIATLPSGYGRVFPATRAVAASTGTTVTVRDASVFRIGEAVSLVTATPQGTPSVYPGTAIGTIAAIDLVNNIITLSAAATVGSRDTILGDTANNPASIIGMVLTAVDISRNSNDVAAYTSCTVYGTRLLYWDSAIAALFPEITLFRNALQFL